MIDMVDKMSNEVAVVTLKHIKYNIEKAREKDDSIDVFGCDRKALDMAIKALKQQSCEDCISREAVEEMIKAEMPERGMWEMEGDTVKNTVCEVCVDLMQELSKLPSVTPQPKIGRWEKVFDEHSYWYKCSCCGEKIPKNFYGNDYFSSYCPECGVKMEIEGDD